MTKHGRACYTAQRLPSAQNLSSHMQLVAARVPNTRPPYLESSSVRPEDPSSTHSLPPCILNCATAEIPVSTCSSLNTVQIILCSLTCHIFRKMVITSKITVMHLYIHLRPERMVITYLQLQTQGTI